MPPYSGPMFVSAAAPTAAPLLLSTRIETPVACTGFCCWSSSARLVRLTPTTNEVFCGDTERFSPELSLEVLPPQAATQMQPTARAGHRDGRFPGSFSWLWGAS